jgi:hypothetical protein
MLSKLDGLYDKEDELLSKINKLRLEYTQLQQDKELLQMMIMHQSNKHSLLNKYKKNKWFKNK